MTKEALKLALEAVEEAVDCAKNGYISNYLDDWENAITAIKAALAQPEQKRPQNCGTGYCSCIECVMEPPQRKPLTESMIKAGLAELEAIRQTELVGDYELIKRLLEAAHGIKENT